MSAWDEGRAGRERAADRLWRHDGGGRGTEGTSGAWRRANSEPGTSGDGRTSSRGSSSDGRWRDGVVHGGDDAAGEAAAGMARTRDGLLTDARTRSKERPPARILGPRLVFLTAVAALVAIGLVMVYSSSSVVAYNAEGIADPAHYFQQQLAALAVSVVLAFLVAKPIPYRFWSNPKVGAALVVGICILLVITIAKGAGGDEHGATRWISVGGFSLQPSEFAKVVCVLVVSGIQVRLSRGEIEPDLRHYGLALILTLVPMLALIFFQPDMGTVFIVVIGLLVILVMSGVPKKDLVKLSIPLAALAVVALFVAQYRASRVDSFLGAFADPLNIGAYKDQVRSSIAAFASGGFFGVGLGNGVQKYSYLSENHTDFIFAVIGEELGALGCLVVVGLYVLLVWSGLRIACETSSPYGRLVASCSTLLLGVQAVINMLMTLGGFPVMGKTLPFISYGGSSLVASMLLVGFVLAVSCGDAAGDPAVRRRDKLRILSGGKARSRAQGRSFSCGRRPRLATAPTGPDESRGQAGAPASRFQAVSQGASPGRARGTARPGSAVRTRLRG